jgi:hypothetical protein
MRVIDKIFRIIGIIFHFLFQILRYSLLAILAIIGFIGKVLFIGGIIGALNSKNH